MVYRQQVSIRLFSIASCLALLLTLLSTTITRAADVAISDGASVLNINKIKTEASSLSHSIYIFTTPDFTSASASTSTPPEWLKDPTAIAQYQEAMLPTDFDSHTKDTLTEQGKDIAIGIDVKDRYISIQSNQGVPLSNDAARQAVSDFKANFSDNDYTDALIAALHDIRITLNEHAWDGLWTALKFVGIVLAFVLICVIGYVFRGNSSRRSGYYYHNSSYHSDSSFGSGSSSSNNSDSGGSGGGAGGFF